MNVLCLKEPPPYNGRFSSRRKLLPNSDGGDSGGVNDGAGIDGRGNGVGNNHGMTVVAILVMLSGNGGDIDAVTVMTSLPGSVPVNPDSSLTGLGSIPSLA